MMGLTFDIIQPVKLTQVCFPLRSKTRGMNFNFPTKRGTGIEKLLPHASKEAIDLIYKLCTYDPDDRISAKQALKDPYFRELR